MRCSYCQKEIEKGTGIMFVRKNGSVRYYCSNRCLRRDRMHMKISKKEIEENLK
jgi:large subunit ribosomal protein L24e